MGRGDINRVIGTEADQNAVENQNSNTSFTAAQNDINTYQQAVGSFQAANPYVTGGAAQTAENQEIADTSAGQAQRLGQALQGSAVRGGQNPGAAIAAGKEITAENTRAGMGAEAAATQSRLGAGTSYNEAGLKGLGEQTTMQSELADEQGKLAQGALATEGSVSAAATNESFMDEIATGTGRPPQTV